VKRSSNERAILRIFVRDRLAEGWTPEQICGWLKSGNEPRLRAIGCETIYAFLYRTAQKAEALWRYLTRRHKRRRPRRARPSRDTIVDRASIHDRPKMSSKSTVGDACAPSCGIEEGSSQKIRRLMREYGLQPRIRRAVATTDSNHDQPIYPNRTRELTIDGGYRDV
jgi:hypothetical protein